MRKCEGVGKQDVEQGDCHGLHLRMLKLSIRISDKYLANCLKKKIKTKIISTFTNVQSRGIHKTSAHCELRG